MHEVDVNDRLRELCRQILDEQDHTRVQELTKTLKSTLQASQEEARLRMSFVARHYRSRLQDVPSDRGAERFSPGAGRIRALLDFLGLGAGMRLGREFEG